MSYRTRVFCEHEKWLVEIFEDRLYIGCLSSTSLPLVEVVEEIVELLNKSPDALVEIKNKIAEAKEEEV